MSTTGGDTSTGGRKRGACDRCRGQKLRCISHSHSQDPSDTRCVRCAKAGADCTTAAPGRAGRPRTSPFSSLEEQKGKINRRNQNNRVASRVDFDAYRNGARVDSSTDGWRKILQGNSVDGESSGNTDVMTPNHVTSSLPMHDSSDALGRVNLEVPASLWSVETLPHPFHDDAGEVLDFAPLGLEFTGGFHDYHAQHTVTQALTASPTRDLGHFRDGSVDANETPAQRPSNEVMDIDMPDKSTLRAPLKTPNPRPPRASNQNREEARMSVSSIMGSTADIALSMNSTREMTGTTLNEESLSEVRHRRTQKLAELAVDLHAQVVNIDSDNRLHDSTVTATALRDQLVGSVLKSSITFSTLLDSFSTSTATPSPSFTSSPTNFATFNNHDNLNSTFSDSDISASASSIEIPVVNEAMHHPCDDPSTSCSDDPKASPSIDITIILQLVICYIHIIHLHSVMYSRILDYSVAFPPHCAHHLDPVFPGMRVGGVSLDKFGMFQIKLLVQISVHVLGRIEMTLGLPERHRVGKRKNDRSGLLDSNLSGTFVDCLMKDKAWKSANVESVRKHLKDLGEVLEDAIEI